MSTTDMFDEITAAAPPVDHSWATSPSGQRVMARALDAGNLATPPAGRRHRRRRVGIVIGALTVAGAATAATVAVATQPDNPTQAGCYETLSADGNTTEASPVLVAEVGAIEACRQTWASLHDDVDVRNLTSCVNAYGGRGVFPAPPGLTEQEACTAIGWRPAD